ncbi:MAG: hypothetical protein ACI9XO_002913 [Paraglaciecola sp.]|jgi:hypothetical protein
MEINTDLQSAFLATTYNATSKNGTTFHLKINEHNPAFDQFLKEENVETWAYLTAWNPNAIAHADKENKDFNTLLEQKLSNLELKYFKGFGVPEKGSDWQPEASFLILGMELENALKLGAELNQAAIVCGKIGDVAKLFWI